MRKLDAIRLERLFGRVEALEEQVDALKGQVESLKSKRGPGRPKKEQEAT